MKRTYLKKFVVATLASFMALGSMSLIEASGIEIYEFDTEKEDFNVEVTYIGIQNLKGHLYLNEINSYLVIDEFQINEVGYVHVYLGDGAGYLTVHLFDVYNEPVTIINYGEDGVSVVFGYLTSEEAEALIEMGVQFYDFSHYEYDLDEFSMDSFYFY